MWIKTLFSGHISLLKEEYKIRNNIAQRKCRARKKEVLFKDGNEEVGDQDLDNRANGYITEQNDQTSNFASQDFGDSSVYDDTTYQAVGSLDFADNVDAMDQVAPEASDPMYVVMGEFRTLKKDWEACPRVGMSRPRRVVPK